MKEYLRQDIGVITATGDVCFGKPRIKGTKIPTRRIFRIHEHSGIEGVLEQFPELHKEDVLAAVRYELGIEDEQNI